MKKSNIFIALKIVLFMVVLAVVLLKISDVLEQKTSRYYRTSVTEQDSPIDVLVIGSSHAKNGIVPYYLWKDYGISSYNFASSGEKIQLSYYTLKDIIEDVKPKVVVLDAYLSPSGAEEGISMQYGLVHESMDYMDFDENKIELAKVLSVGRDENALAFLSNIYAYHYRWKELEKTDFIENYSLEKGGLFLAGISAFDEIPIFEGNVKDAIKEGAGYEYLNKIMDLCEENDAEFLLINIPYTTQNEDAVNRQVTFRQCVDERGFNSIYYPEIMDDVKIDSCTDFKDKGHLNIIGAKKMTEYVGSYLVNEMGLVDHRGNDTYQAWNDFERDFEEARLEKAENTINADAYAMNFWESKKYRVEIVTYDGNISEKALADYAFQNKIKVSKYDDLDDSLKEYIDDKLVQDDFTEATMMVLVYDKNNGDIVASHRFIYYDRYRDKVEEN